MFRFSLRFRQFVVLTAVVLTATAALMIPVSAARGEVHYFCPILAGTQCGILRARSAAVVEQIAPQAGNNAAAQQAINVVRYGVSNDTLSGAQLVDLAHAMRTAAPPAAQANVKVAIAQLAVNQQVQLWLKKGIPGTTAVPPGANVPIALVPGVPLGRIIPTGFGPVIIGVDQGGDAVVLGQGNVDQVAAEVSGTSAGNVDVTLANPTSTAVNYTVNQQPYSMAPTFTQNLTGGSSWVVQFDRGGGNGTAQYQLAEGYYEFAVTPQGWELYQKQKPSPATVAGASAISQPPAEPSPYPQAVGMQLPKDFKLFDPVPVLTGSQPATAAAQLPVNFTLFRAAAERVAQTEPPGRLTTSN